MRTIERKTFKKLLFLYVPLLYIALGTMISVYSSKILYIDWMRLLTSAIGIVMLYTTTKCHNKVFSALTWFSLLIIFVSILYYFIDNSPTAHSFLDIGDSVMWISVMYIAYRISYRGEKAIQLSKMMAYFIPVFTIVFAKVKAFFILNTDDTALISTAYYSLFLLPFALFVRNKYIKWCLVLCIFASVLLSSKRGGFIAFFSALLVYFYYDLKLKKASSRWKSILGSVIAIVLVLIFMEDFVQQNNLTIFDRLANIREDKGSGRDVVYEYTWEMIKSSDLASLIFGHGFNAVYHDSALELSAHTDTLEIIYDYGIIGCILYLMFYVGLVSYYKKLKMLCPQYAAPFAVSLVLVLVLSLFAHLIIYPTHFLYICAFWGICMGECDKKKYLYGQSC